MPNLSGGRLRTRGQGGLGLSNRCDSTHKKRCHRPCRIRGSGATGVWKRKAGLGILYSLGGEEGEIKGAREREGGTDGRRERTDGLARRWRGSETTDSGAGGQTASLVILMGLAAVVVIRHC